MSDQIPDWEVISKQGKKFTFWQMLFGFLLGEPPHSTFKFKVRQKSTGIIKTVTAYDEGELPERIAKGWFDFERIISEEAAEMTLTGIRNGGRRAPSPWTVLSISSGNDCKKAISIPMN